MVEGQPNMTWKWQLHRLMLRGAILAAGVWIGLFWTFALAGVSYLLSVGAMPLVAALGAFYIVLGLPAHVIYGAIFVDLFNYVVTRRSIIIPTMLATPPSSHPPSRWVARAMLIVGSTSPFLPLAMWSLVVLRRVPEENKVALGPVRSLEWSPPEHEIRSSGRVLADLIETQHLAGVP